MEPEAVEYHVEDNDRLAEPAEDPQPGVVDTHESRRLYLGGAHLRFNFEFNFKTTEIGKKAWLFSKQQPGRARKRIYAT